jgi:TRAP-type C4-dicarboxylate transport system permease large subunit
MSGPVLGVAGIAIMFAALFILRIPAGFTMAIVGFLGLAYATSFQAALGMIGTEMWNIFSGYGLTVIPMFILVGEFVHYAGYNDSLYYATHRWFGHHRGGLAITTIMASAAFSAISGSNTATAATMSTVAIPAMKKYGYPPILNAGAVAAGATLGVLIPPSIVLVVYGIYTGQSIGKLFFGNVIPSVIATVLIAATVWLICRRHPDWGPAAEKSSWRERFQALPEALDIIVLFLVIMAALFTGLVTATEAAAVSCTLGLAICLLGGSSPGGFFAPSRTRPDLMHGLHDHRGRGLRPLLAITRLPFEAAPGSGRDHAQDGPLGLILLCYIVAAASWTPWRSAHFLPSSTSHHRDGLDPIWFGQVVTIVTTMGAIMPRSGSAAMSSPGWPRHPPGHGLQRRLLYIPAYVVAIIFDPFPLRNGVILSNLVR